LVCSIIGDRRHGQHDAVSALVSRFARKFSVDLGEQMLVGLDLRRRSARLALTSSRWASSAAVAASSANSPLIRRTVADASSRPAAERVRSLVAISCTRRPGCPRAVPHPGAHRATGGPDPFAGRKERHKRCEERWIIQQRVYPRQLSGSRSSFSGGTDSHNEHRPPTVGNTMASIPSSTKV
jgi:hypothetical protein